MRLYFAQSVIASLTICASLLCSACGSSQLDLEGKSPEQAADAIKGLDKKITEARLQPTVQGPNVVWITWLANSGPSPLLMEQTDIKTLLQSIALAKGNDNIGWVLLFLNETGVDQLGNKSPVLALKLGWNMETLKKVNWDGVQNWQLIDLASIEGVGPFGKNAIDAYCKDGASSYGKTFCTRAGWRG